MTTSKKLKESKLDSVRRLANMIMAMAAFVVVVSYLIKYMSDC